MAYRISYPSSLLFLFFLMPLVWNSCVEKNMIEDEEKLPNSWFFMQRAYPVGFIPKAAYLESLKAARAFRTNQITDRTGNQPWEFAGPLNTGGRITDLEMPDDDPNTIYVGAASGGIFKSTDRGFTWQSVFDDAGSLSIGDLALAPSNQQIIYAGTGEANAGGGSLAYDGVGLYKSVSGGQSWEFSGLEDAGSIGKIVVHPKNPDMVTVAAMGDLFGNNPDRGIFKSIDGGLNWNKVLFVNDSTGGIDLVIHPQHGDTMYAAMWERVRRPHRRSYGGEGSGVYRTYDGGATWEKLDNGWPTNRLGRIGLVISPSNPTILYAILSNESGDHQTFLKTTNGGDTWENISHTGFGGSSFMWWFGKIFIHPTNPDKLYAASLDMFGSDDGGATWTNLTTGQAHVDQHALIPHPANPDQVVIGNDGGLYISYDGGQIWEHIQNLPITQFYTCEIDYSVPERLYGGTQDNGTNRTLTGALDDWERIYGGDGFVVLVDPTDNSYVYAESQYGALGRSENGGNTFRGARNGIGNTDRKNWKTPVILDPSDPQTLYYGSQFVYRSTNRAQSWQKISPDLSNGPGDNLTFGTVTTIAVSPLNSSLIYAGTDDGNVWRTRDGGGNWDKISADLPVRWITSIAADPFEEGSLVVTISGYRYYDEMSHVYQSSDFGDTWRDITGNMPDAPANDVILDPDQPGRYYLANDFGVYETLDGGVHWDILAAGLPNVPVVDLTYHRPTRTLVAATYGRSMYKTTITDPVSTQNLAVGKIKLGKLFPNPVKRDCSIVIECVQKSQLEIHLYDMAGKYVHGVWKGNVEPGAQQLDFQISEDLPKGAYFLRFKDDLSSVGYSILKQ